MFLKFKSVNKDLTLLNKVLLLQAKNPSYSLETEVLGFFKQSRRQLTKSLETLGLFSLHDLYPLLEGQASIIPYSQVYKTPALSSQFF